MALDPNPDAPGKALADHFYVVAGNDYDTTKQIALKHRVDGLATTQMEKPLRLMAKLAQELGLPFHSPEVVERSLDKWLMKQAFLQYGIPCARGKLFKKNEEIKEYDLNDFRYPLVLKPKDATSSQGVFRVEKFSEIKQCADETRKFSRNGELIIEEFLEGKEYSVETITFKGKTTIVQYTEKFITPFPYTVEMGHLQPADLSDEEKRQIDKVVTAAINVISIDNSAAHTEVKITPEGPKILEIGSRGGGDFISSYLTLASTGISMDEAIIKVALGKEPDLRPKTSKYSCIKYFSLPVGKRVDKVADYSEIFKEEHVVFAHIALKEGDMIEEITESKKRPGFVITKSKDRDTVLKIAKDLCKYLSSRIKLKDKSC
ncbi:MAG TPA: ATP-grasp domain-containing protein [Mariniphaga anaerophila]|uniref:ATP-grasp domain-containing protein n=1 Tax=Mariniphaga anaerophila TaxID=1484053 RepID=A0A831LL69_9BACT|nr:ATP-grasp domain-containing protein [Mariniphaga anaerophila]